MSWSLASGLGGHRLCPLPDRGLSFPVWERRPRSPAVPERPGQPCLGLRLAMGQEGSALDEPRARGAVGMGWEG